MRSALLVLAAPVAAIASLTLPAAAAADPQSLSTAGFTAVRDVGSGTLGTMRPPPPFFDRVIRRDHDGDGDGDHRRRRHRDRDIFVSNWADGDWALYNNRSFESDSYNDWWHDRPDRAYPAWMRRNKNCERVWYSAGELRC